MTGLGSTFFGSGADLNAGQECARALVVSIYAMPTAALVGRRSEFERSTKGLLLLIVVGTGLSGAIVGETDLWSTLAASTVLIALGLVATGAGSPFRSRRRKVVDAPSSCPSERARSAASETSEPSCIGIR